jgi:hypothetical protein
MRDPTIARILARATVLALESGAKGEDETLLTLERVCNEQTCNAKRSKPILPG